MRRYRIAPLPSSEITPECVWLSRRTWLQQTGTALVVAASATMMPGVTFAATNRTAPPSLSSRRNSDYVVQDDITAEQDVTSYNNFYEFGTGKADPMKNAGTMEIDPWTVRVEGEVAHPGTFDVDTLRKLGALEERIYRLRCVEGWSMVIPWIGYSLSTLLSHVEPTASARYVEFVTATQPANMPGLAARIIDWPYVEGLRLDEAMHPLTMLVFGVYGKQLPNQNGAPLRLIVPWKYGFKSGKSIVAIRVREDMPLTSWVKVAPNEYGFYANVNPNVPHPRWSQATERRIGSGLFAPRIATQMFNGYGDDVAHLYQGMDLARFY